MANDIKNKSVVIYIDQGAAQQALEQLQKSADKLNKKIDEGRLAGKSMAAEIKKLGETKDSIQSVQDQIDKGLRPSFSQTQTLVTKLRNELKRMSEEAPGYAQKFEAFQSARIELDRLSQSFGNVEKAQKSWLQEAKGVAFGVLIGNTVQTAVEAIGGYFSGIISGNAKLSDSFSDVEKATGLSAEKVKELSSDLNKIDTRTKAADLREIAVGLGQIGQEATKANVQAIDQIVVALGDEFGGGAKEITTTLSVLRNNLQDIKTGNYATDVTHIGNALNVLGAEGLATAPVVTDIANRIAGISQTFKLSSGQILGLAATFQELGIETERGSTAVTKLFQKIGAEPEKFAKVAGVSIKEFKDLVNKDMLGAFQLVAEGAKKAGSNNIVFSQVLKELDADGSGAGEVLSKLGSNSELLANKVNTATVALKGNGSIIDEFTKKNTNLAAELEKLEKDINSIITSKTLSDLFAAGVSALRNFIAALKAVPQFLKENQTAVYFLVAGIVLLNGSLIKSAVLIARDSALKLANAVVTRITAVASNIAIAAQLAYYEITALLTRQITLATAAQRLWNIAMSLGAGPIGVILALVGAAIVAFTFWTSRTKELTAAQQKANLEMEKSKQINETWAEVQKTANSNIAETITKLQDYAKAAEDTSKSDDQRKQAIQGIISINPEYFKGLDLEAVKTGVLRTKVDEYSEALKAAALQKAIFDKRVTLEQSKLDLEQKQNPGDITGKDGKAINLIPTQTISDGIQLETAGQKLLKKQKADIQKQIDVVDAQLHFLDNKTEELKKKTKDIPGLTDPAATTTAQNPFGDKDADKKAKKEETERNKLLQQLKDFQFELTQVGKQADESEIERIGKKYDELIQKANRYGLSYIEVEKEKNRAIAYLLDQEEKKRQDAIRKQNVRANEETYKNFQESAVSLGEKQKEAETKKYADGLQNKRQLEENIRRIDIETLAFQIGIAQSFVGVSKQASSDIVAFNKKKNKENLEDAVKTREFKEALAKREALASAQVSVLKTRDGSEGRLKAQLNLLKVEHDQELENTELTNSQKEKLNEEYRQKQAELTVQFYIGQINQTLNFLSQGLDIISKLNASKDAKEKAALDRELKNNELRKNSIKKLEESKAISSQEARRRITNIEKEEDAKKEALEKKQFERNKKLQITQAIINGALGITAILAAVPGPLDILSLGVSRYIAIGLNIATTAAAIKEISSKKYGRGGKLSGPSHSSGGMPVINPVTGRKEAEVEGGEYILSKHTVANNREIADALLFSSMNRGGARIRRFWESRPYRSLDYPNISERMTRRRFSEGGVFGNPPATAAPQTAATDPAVLEALQQSHAVNVALLGALNNMNNHLANGIDARVSLKKIDDARSQQQRILNDSQLR